MLKVTLKQSYSKKIMNHFARKSLKYFKFGVSCMLPFHIFCSTFFYSLKLITNRASEFFAIFIIRESTKKIDRKLSVVSLIGNTYIFTGDRIQKVFP